MSEEFNVSYHSIHGAITESNHVFIDAALQYKVDDGAKKISIFEMGFGTGLNAFLTYQYAEKNKITIDYQAIELYPIEKVTFDGLNYGDLLGNMDQFIDLHLIEWNKKLVFSSYYTFEKILEDLVTFPMRQTYDIIYYDAFAPNAQPELWTTHILDKMYHALNENGVLVSYCAQGEFKRNLKKVGFSVEELPGPPGKREMTRAVKPMSLMM